ncbi:hypothetical protein ACLKA7_005650 [Drosophila subpalustris]
MIVLPSATRSLIIASSAPAFHGHDKEVATFSLDTSKQPLTFHNSTAVVLALSNFGLIDLYDLANTAQFWTAVGDAPINPSSTIKSSEISGCLHLLCAVNDHGEQCAPEDFRTPEQELIVRKRAGAANAYTWV